MAGTFTITSVAGSGPSYVLTVSSSSGAAVDDYVACGILGVATYDGGIYRITSVPDASTINIQDDVGATPYGKPSNGRGQYYTPTTEKKLSQLVTGGYYWAEPQRRDARVIDESFGNSVPTSRSINNGTGISGGGDLTADRTLSVNQTALNPENMDSGSATTGQAPLASGGGIVWGDVVLPTRAINNGTGISGGGNLSADRTLSVDQSALDPTNMSSGGATSGQVPTASGGGAITWEDQSGGGGDVAGPGSSADNSVVAFDGTTGKVIKEPNAALDFKGQNISNVGSVAGHVPTSRQIIDGTGISGGGDLTADRTLSVAQGALDPANMSSGGASANEAPLANGATGIAWGTVVLPSRAINNGTGISGGGDLSADRTLSVDESALDPANMGSGAATVDYVPKADGIGGVAWGPISGSGVGDVSGPASSTDNGVVVFDGTGGKTIKGADAAVNFGAQNITNIGSDQTAFDPVNMSSGSATSGQVPTASGGGAITWEDQSGGGGDVTGPSSSTNNGVVTFDGTTGKIIKGANAAVDFNAQNISNVGSVAGHVPTTRAINNGTGISGGGDLSADRTLSVNQSALDPANMSSGSATDGYVATADGIGGVAWEEGGGGGGDVTGPGSSTDHALPRWDGIGGDTLLNSGVTLSDTDAMVFPTGGSISKPGTGTNSEAYGNGATAGGNRGVAVGYNATAPGNYATIVGGSATGVSGDGATAIGFSADAGINSVCIGRECTALDVGMVVIGYQSYAHVPASGDNWGAIAIGLWAEVGDAAQAGCDAGIAIGYDATVGYGSTDAIAIGYNANVVNSTPYAIAIGSGATVNSSADRAVAIGQNAIVTANSDYGVAIGRDSYAQGIWGIAIGYSSRVLDNYGMAIGDAYVYGQYAIGIGHSALVDSASTNSVAIGRQAEVHSGSVDSVAIGYQADISNGADDAVAIGKLAEVTTTNGIAIGDSASATGTTGISIGVGNFVDGPYGISIGNGSSCRSGSTDSIAIGHTATVWNSMSYCIAIGRSSDCEGSAVRAIAIGDNADAHHDQAIALGAGADTTANNRCTIGTIGGSYDVDLEFGKGLGCWGVTPPGTQPAKINDPSGGTTIDAEARTAINAIIDVLEGCGLSST